MITCIDMNNNNAQLSKKELYDQRKIERQKQMLSEAKSKKLKRLILWGAAFLLLISGGWFVVRSGNMSESSALLTDTVSSTDWVRGDENASVVLIEYGDFQCPACGAYYPMIKNLENEFAGKMRFVYRHFPLKQIHKNADISARASEAAGKQGKFWEMYDKLFENQTAWSESPDAKKIFTGYAEDLGFNLDIFTEDLDSDDIKNKISNDYESGIKSKVNSTPTFFLNGERVQPKDYDDFKQLIEAKISQS